MESFFRRLALALVRRALPAGGQAMVLLLTSAVAPALAQRPSCTYSNIVINLVTSTNAATFRDSQGHTFSNVTVKLIPSGLAWCAKDGSEGRLAITNLDHLTLADITGLCTNQVAYLIRKKAMEDNAYLRQNPRTARHRGSRQIRPG